MQTGSKVEVLKYRSENGVGDSRILPFELERQHIYDYMDSFYKMYVMNSIKACSTLPVFEGPFKPPFENRVYVLDKRQFNLDDYPNVLDGFYKAALLGHGEVTWSMNFTGQLS
ncbi:uncharacterized protein LOC133328079 [Musca vetustissima]|uniref:uncharacterized protein LOC133328079 n=1 Tax=Musca vetustissima TaxID=27455 RepID=UPI002AB6407F|nr:uncharacterized protein LOC133328079 [Musca vetustissima]